MSKDNSVKTSQSLANLEKAYKSLTEDCSSPITEDRDKAGIIKNFEFVYELFWKAMKRKLEDEGQSTTTPKDVIRRAFEYNYILDEEIWLQIIKDRNLTVHTYDQNLADELVKHIKEVYIKEFGRVLELLR